MNTPSTRTRLGYSDNRLEFDLEDTVDIRPRLLRRKTDALVRELAEALKGLVREIDHFSPHWSVYPDDIGEARNNALAALLKVNL